MRVLQGQFILKNSHRLSKQNQSPGLAKKFTGFGKIPPGSASSTRFGENPPGWQKSTGLGQKLTGFGFHQGCYGGRQYARQFYYEVSIFLLQVSISSITIPQGHDLKGAKPSPQNNHFVQKPSPRDRTGSQKPHPRDIKLENFTNISMNSDTI